jgi:hypothetical protein
MDLQSYIDLSVLLQNDQSTKEERRAFGLSHIDKKEMPEAQLSAWLSAHRGRLSNPDPGERFDTFMYTTTLILIFLALAAGLLCGVGLLSYSGEAPVNVVYFLAIAVFLPLLTMAVTLFSIFLARRRKNVLVHLSPAFWMEKLMISLAGKDAELLREIRIAPILANWMVIKRAQMIALAFSLGLFAALVGVVATKDIAFAWSTTLDIPAESFHTFLNMLAFAWREWLPSAVPSLELIEKSHYFRLGGVLEKGMVSHAALLGSWWKFLAAATLFYAVLLRFFFYLFSIWGTRYALKQALFSIDGVRKLLKEMNEPLITSRSPRDESSQCLDQRIYIRMLDLLERSYDAVQGWAISKRQLNVICDSFSIESAHCEEAGGSNTLEADQLLIDQSSGHVVLFVKAWEAPDNDFKDYLQMLSRKVESVVIVPLGTEHQSYKASSKDREVWARELAALDLEKVWMKQ